VKVIYALFVAVFASLAVFSQADAPFKVTLNNVELTYIERGRGEPVILLHGGQADYRAWQYATEHLSKNYRVISYSRRYNYPNKNPIIGSNHSAYVEAEDLAAFIGKLNLDRVHLVGTSIGGYAALIYAVKHPKKVLTLTLAEPNIHAWVLETPAFREFLNNTWVPAGNAFRAGDDREAMRLLVDAFGGTGAFDRMPPTAQTIALQNANFFRAATLSADHSPDIDKKKVRRLKVPILLINGEKTKPMLLAIVEEFAKVVPTAERHVIKNAGHGSPREKPEEFTAAVADFLARRSKKNKRN
jgi:non-heme chloroperoxidase